MAKSFMGANCTKDEVLMDITAVSSATGAFVSGSTMTVSPETTAEDGFLRIKINGTTYQIPVYLE